MPIPDVPDSTPHLLVIEDELKTRESVATGFALEGWRVLTAATAADALKELDRARFDLLVLDWMLPDRDGIELVQQLRAAGNFVPVLMLTARNAVQDRIAGLDSGADDYLPKPFALAELVARCRALLRRPSGTQDRVLRYADLQLDTRARIVTRGNTEIPLTPREVDLLEYLLRNLGNIVTREMLERDVWKQTHRLSSLNNVIDVQMTRLRRKIDVEGAERFIVTVRGVGYQIGVKAA